MLLVSEKVRNAIVNNMKAMVIGYLCPILSASFPDGIRESMLVAPLIPKSRTIRDKLMRRFSSAWIAKKVIRKAFVKEKTNRR